MNKRQTLAPVANRYAGFFGRITAIDRYVFRLGLGAFLLVLGGLTALVWVTQALRGIDLMTSKGQTILVFLGITGLAIPLLVMVIMPIALTVALVYVLNKLANDSEIIVMNAAGMQPWQLFRPLAALTVIVSLLIAALAAYVSPAGLQGIKRWTMQISADIVANLLQPGRFVSITPGFTLRIGERRTTGEILQVFVDDRRDPKQWITITAERGDVLLNERGTFLVLQNGSLQRLEAGQRDPALVAFDSYAFDMSQFAAPQAPPVYSVIEQYVWQLAFPDPKDTQYIAMPGAFRAELHNRLTAPLYPIAFLMITFAFLGAPRTTRQSRAFSIGMTIVVAGALRIAGFALTVLANQSVLGPILQYGLIAIACIASYWIIARGIIVSAPAGVSDWMTAITGRLTQRLARA